MVKRAKKTLTILAKIKSQGMPTCSGFNLSGQSYRIIKISPPKLPEATKTCTIINMTIIAMLSQSQFKHTKLDNPYSVHIVQSNL